MSIACAACAGPLPEGASRHRKLCVDCAAAARGSGTRYGATDEKIAASSEALLRALVAYGWKHDGLPGLGPWEFRALAREIGVTA